MLRGHALYFTIVIALLIALLSGSILLIAQFRAELVISDNHQIRLIDNAQSGVAYLLSDQMEDNSTLTMDLFGEGADSVLLIHKRWGLYEAGVSCAFSGGDSVVKQCILGYSLDPSDNQALYVQDHNRPVSFCGKTEVVGTAFLPRAGVKRAYIEGKTFQGSRLVQGAVKYSDTRMPKLDIGELKEAYRLSGELQQGDSLVRSFDAGAWQKAAGAELKGVYRGHVVVKSSGHVRVSAAAVVEDVVLIAPSVEVEEGFKGRIQILVTDSVRLRENVELSYPSAIGLIKRKENKSQSKVVLEKGAVLSGMILVTQEQYDKTKTLTSIDEGSVLTGEVYTDGYLQVKGVIKGKATCSKLALRTSSGAYENHLLDAVIDRSQLSEFFVTGSILTSDRKKQVAKWIHL